MRKRTRRDFLKLVGGGIVTAALPGVTLEAATTKRPNFVFILIDDLGWKDLGCFGSTFYETPHIDRLAAGGMRFTNAYAACPVCSPTRASIMTGKYPVRIPITNFIAGRRKGKLLPPDYLYYMPLEEETLAEAFKKGGYATCFAGKWHLGGEGYHPDKQGFDINVGGNHRGSPPSYFSPYRNPNLADGPEGEYLTDRLTTESLKFIEANQDHPFFLYLSYYTVHIPLQAKKELVKKYEAKAVKLGLTEKQHFLLGREWMRTFPGRGKWRERIIQDHAVYAAMIESMDENIGRIAKKLEALGIAGDTVVIFMSDNGGLATSEGSPTTNLPLRAGKGWLYEGGIREPMFIKGPGVARPGSTCDVPVTSTDFYPTLLELAGLPLRPGQHLDGVSLVPLLKGERELERKAIYWHYPHYSNQGGRPGGAVRMGDYKLIEFFEDLRVELYNLKEDIGERRSLARKMPEKVAQMRRLLHEWRQETKARMPTINPDYRFNR